MKTKHLLKTMALTLTLLLAGKVGWGQVTLTGTSYAQDFDGIGSGLPTGWTVRTGATTAFLGTPATLTTAATAWNNTSGGFKNFASADGLSSSAKTEDQNDSHDRALGVRLTQDFGDPGAAFVLQLSKTKGFKDFTLSFKIQSLDVESPRIAVWSVDYATGASTDNSFTSVTTTPDTLTLGGKVFSSTDVSVNFGSALNDIDDVVWIRIVVLSATTGSGNRPSVGIDDYTLSYSALNDTQPPSLVPANLIPADNATDVDINTTLTIPFDENIQKGTGNIRVKRADDDSDYLVIDVISSDVSVTNATATVTLPSNLNFSTDYYVNIDAGAFKDLADNDFA